MTLKPALVSFISKFKRRLVPLIPNVLRRMIGRGVRLDPNSMWGRIFDLTRKELVKLDGFNLYVMPDDYVGGPILQTKSYEPHVTSLIRTHLKAGDVFLDLGAHIGYFSLLASALVGKGGRVLVFEPNPQNQQLIFASILENKAENLMVYPWAVSDRRQVLRFTTVGSNGGVINAHSRYENHYLLVQPVIMDDVLAREPRIDLIKMDIEAHEPIALRGMLKLLATHKPKLMTEFHPWAMEANNLEPPRDFLDRLHGLGYRLSIIKRSSAKRLTWISSLNSEGWRLAV